MPQESHDRAMILFEYTVRVGPKMVEFTSKDDLDRKVASASTVATISLGARRKIAFTKPSDVIVALKSEPNEIKRMSDRVRILDEDVLFFGEDGNLIDEVSFVEMEKSPELLREVMKRIRKSLVHPSFRPQE